MWLSLQRWWVGCTSSSSVPYHCHTMWRARWEGGYGERKRETCENRWEGEGKRGNMGGMGERGGRLISGEEEKREMRHIKTLVCNQVAGAVRIVVVCRRLPQPFRSTLQCHTHTHISDTTQTTALLLPPLSERKEKKQITIFMSVCAEELHISSYWSMSHFRVQQRGLLEGAGAGSEPHTHTPGKEQWVLSVWPLSSLTIELFN